MHARPVGGQDWFISEQKGEPQAAHNERPRSEKTNNT